LELLENNSGVNVKNPSEDTPLHLACAGGHTSIVKQLLRHGASVDVFNRLGKTPLHEASAHGHAEIVEMLCKHGATIDVIDFYGKRPLGEAVVRGYTEVVKILTNYNADVNKHVNGQSDFMASAGSLKKNLNIPKFPDIEQLPLASAVYFRDEDIIQILLDNGAHVNVPSKDGWTPLHVASYNGDINAVKVLLEKEAGVNKETEMGATALIVACQEGHVDVAQLLLQHGAQVDHTQADGATAMMLASQGGHDPVVELLLQHQAAISATLNGKNASALQLAVQYGYSHTAQLIIRRRHDSLETALLSDLLILASWMGDVDVVKRLLELGADIEARWGPGVFPLMAAVLKGHANVTELLLQRGADVETSISIDQSTLTPLIVAVQRNHTAIVDLILQNDSRNLVNQVYGPQPITLLDMALINGNLEMFHTLLVHKADPSLKQLKNFPRYPISMLCMCANRGNASFVKMLLDHGSNPNAPCFEEIYPMNLAILANSTEVVSLLLQYGAKTHFDLPDGGYISILGYAAYTGNAEIVQFLINRTFDLETSDLVCNNMMTPLGIAAVTGHYQVAQILLQNGANVNAIFEEGTPLCVAARFGNIEIAKLLLQHKANVDLTGTRFKGVTPLFIASDAGHADIVKLLVDHGANVSPKARILTPISSARIELQTDILKGEKIVESIMEEVDAAWSVELEKDDKQYADTTALCQAVVKNNIDVVRILVNHGANMEDMCQYLERRYTPLHAACMFDRKEIAEILLQGGANVNSRNHDGDTPLHLACLMRYKEIIGLLIQYGADLFLNSDDGETPYSLLHDVGDEQNYRDTVGVIAKKITQHKDKSRNKP
jgi:ankyrin repeat protein